VAVVLGAVVCCPPPTHPPPPPTPSGKTRSQWRRYEPGNRWRSWSAGSSRWSRPVWAAFNRTRPGVEAGSDRRTNCGSGGRYKGGIRITFVPASGADGGSRTRLLGGRIGAVRYRGKKLGRSSLVGGTWLAPRDFVGLGVGIPWLWSPLIRTRASRATREDDWAEYRRGILILSASVAARRPPPPPAVPPPPPPVSGVGAGGRSRCSKASKRRTPRGQAMLGPSFGSDRSARHGGRCTCCHGCVTAQSYYTEAVVASLSSLTGTSPTTRGLQRTSRHDRPMDVPGFRNTGLFRRKVRRHGLRTPALLSYLLGAVIWGGRHQRDFGGGSSMGLRRRDSGG